MLVYALSYQNILLVYEDIFKRVILRF